MNKRPETPTAIMELVREQLQAGRDARLRIGSGSMLPLIRPGDTVVVRLAQPATLSKGDVILYEHQGQLCTHRLWAVDAQGPRPMLITKGDARPAPDAPLSLDQFVGRVVAIERGGQALNLDEQPWQAVNWLLAACADAQVIAFKVGRAVKRRLAGDKPWRFTPAYLKIVRSPVLALGRLLDRSGGTKGPR